MRWLHEKFFDFAFKALTYLEALTLWVINGCRFVSRDTADQRLSICHDCDLRQGTTCTECGCSIKPASGLFRLHSKIYFPDETCPVGRWPKSP